ncbi:MAG: pentapeptide repeat-containing protein, partial [Pleurocapsa sp.]
MATETILKRYLAGERNFSQINLREAELVKVNLSNINLTAADLREARLGRSNLSIGRGDSALLPSHSEITELSRQY